MNLLSDNDKISMMGVMNITPNSFSDGGKYNSASTFVQLLRDLKKWNVACFDVGAESTAPFNAPITHDEELKRFVDCLYPCLEEFPLHATLSIDTYRGSTFFKLYQYIIQRRSDIKVIWNDVSGVLDDELWQTLEQCPKASYVFCHTLTPCRELSSHHMNYSISDDQQLLEHRTSRFIEVVKAFAQRGMVDRLFLDPCFGFSKTYSQNLFLLNKLSVAFASILPSVPAVIGISRKSFLKKSIVMQDAHSFLSSEQGQVELMQAALLPKLFKCLGRERPILVRLHRPEVFNASLWANCL